MHEQETYGTPRDFVGFRRNIAQAEVRTPYRMIETLITENFRGFRKLRLVGLKTINVIVGRSGTGKTALLEALRLTLAATPLAAWNLNAQRGLLTGVPPNPTRKQYETAWSSLFLEFNVDKIISLTATDSAHADSKCEIFFDKSKPIVPAINSEQPNIPILPDLIYPIVFERTSGNSTSTRLVVNLSLMQQPQFWQGLNIPPILNYQMQMQNAPDLGISCEIFHANTSYNMQQTAQKYSELSIVGAVDDINETIFEAFPEIKSIQTEAPAAGVTALYATSAYHKNKIPLVLYSAGMSKFISLLVEIQSRKRSVILIDEIENGIWYKIMPAMWNALHKFARKNDAQIFLSTHSLECLKAASTTIDEHPDDFTLIQMAQESEGVIARTASGEDFAAAIESNIELRR